MRFEWDPRKARANERKHGVGLSEAMSVFADPLAAVFDDADHSVNERRELIIGISNRSRLLIVSFVELGERVRLISARAATKREQKDYEER